jgi:pyridoxamine 5'-phosphate oxidase
MVGWSFSSVSSRVLSIVVFTMFQSTVFPFLLRTVRGAQAQTRGVHLHEASNSAVSDLRKEYKLKGLSEEDVPDSPFGLFKTWFTDACDANLLEPNAMCLSTCVDNKPSARFVLLKGYDDRGFVWYTNFNSRKGGELDANPNAALTFLWAELERSVRIEGAVERVSDEEADTYFNSRPRGSQIGAWTSSQSSQIADREALEKQEIEIKSRFADESAPIPRPPHWGGYRIVPTRMEFWKGRESRLHDRIAFKRDSKESDWNMQRLQP